MDKSRTAGYRAVAKRLREPLAEASKELALNFYLTLFRLPPEIGNLRQLKKLTCEGSPVQDLSPIASLVGLEDLNLNDTRVDDLGPLAGMEKMQEAAVLNCSQVLELADYPTQELRSRRYDRLICLYS